MQQPLKITLRDISRSEALEGLIREKASWLELFSDQIIGCRVVVEGPVRHHRKGGPFTVRIDLGVPGEDIVVNRQAAEDPYVAVTQAFDAARRKLQDHVRRQRGTVKVHEEMPHGRVSKLFPDKGYGFLETSDGREVYFHRNSVLGADFDRLSIGTEVRFAEEEGEKGPQASTVVVPSRSRTQGRSPLRPAPRETEGNPGRPAARRQGGGTRVRHRRDRQEGPGGSRT